MGGGRGGWLTTGDRRASRRKRFASNEVWKDHTPHARETRNSRVNPAVTTRACRRKCYASYEREAKAAAPVNRKIGEREQRKFQSE